MCMCELDWILYGSQQLHLLTKWPHPMAARAARLGILEETHKTCVASCVEQSLG